LSTTGPRPRRPAPAGWRRYQPLLVSVRLLVIATAVALVLAQSAGVIHLPLLGSNGSGSGIVTPWLPT
jgi:hypothetical protein